MPPSALAHGPDNAGMTNIFIIGSPLSCLFADLLARRFPDDENLAYFEPAQPHYPRVYPLIDAHLGSNLEKRPLADLDVRRRYGRLFISHRFQPGDVRAVFALRRRVDSVNLHDGEMSLYTGHKHNKSRKNDRSLRLRAKNAVRRRLGLVPSHVYMDEIDYLYSVFAEVPDCPDRLSRVSILDDFRRMAPSGAGSADSCVVLSHPFVFDAYLTIDEYIGYLRALIDGLSQRFATIYFKAHPLEAKGPVPARIHAELPVHRLPGDYDSVPIELFLAENRQVQAFGFWSGSLVYGAGALGVGCATLYPHLLERFPDRAALAAQYAAMKPLMDRAGVGVYTE